MVFLLKLRLRTFGSNHFDFIHGRFLYGSVADEPGLLRQAFNALRPGGWFEQNEVETAMYCDDGTFPMDGAYGTWAKSLSRAFEMIGRPWPTGPELKALFEQAGFVDVQVKELKRPTNDWPKDELMKEIGRVRRFAMSTWFSLQLTFLSLHTITS
jgi:metalloendopeptidase OMA1, mitochondrial